MKSGRIVKALSGFYYVQADKNGQEYACKGRGLFRNQNITPLVGDFVLFDQTNNQEGYITEILPRTNSLVRPPIANVSKALIVCSITQPTFSAQLLNRFLVIVESKEIMPMIVFTKIDLATETERENIATYKQQYESIGYEVVYFSLKENIIPKEIIDFLHKDVTVVMGQTGVGKSTLLNTIDPTFAIKTAEISKSLGRGRHTTRHVELHDVNGGLVADTPGFSSIEFTHIEAEQLGNYFIDIKEQALYCKFRRCQHVREPNCAVKKAVQDGLIAQERYDHYVLFLDEILSRKPRYTS